MPDFPQILKSLDGRNEDMGDAAREVVLRSFKREVGRLMDCARRQHPGAEIPEIVEYDGMCEMIFDQEEDGLLTIS